MNIAKYNNILAKNLVAFARGFSNDKKKNL